MAEIKVLTLSMNSHKLSKWHEEFQEYEAQPALKDYE